MDSEGTIFITINITSTGCSKHVDICYKFVTEYVEDGIIKVTFIKTVDNGSDIMTKNLKAKVRMAYQS